MVKEITMIYRQLVSSSYKEDLKITGFLNWGDLKFVGAFLYKEDLKITGFLNWGDPKFVGAFLQTESERKISENSNVFSHTKKEKK